MHCFWQWPEILLYLWCYLFSITVTVWVFPAILGGIGLFYLVFNIGAVITSRKLQKEGADHHVSGIPFLGGIHILIAGLISPIKWLALLCVLDYTFWSFLYAVFFVGIFKKDKDTEEK